MREVKFRVWDDQSKQMSLAFHLFGEFTMLGGVHAWQEQFRNDSLSSLQRLNGLKIMQYTGLKDKNGKEIYEGDALEADNYFCNADQHCYSGVFEIRHKGGAFTLKGKGWELSVVRFDVSEFEKVGNIYENPELLGIDQSA